MRSFIIAICLVVPLVVSSQSAEEAITLGHTLGVSTARNAAMGGAFNALGGDFESIKNNPGGLGVYRSSNFLFTPSFELGYFDSDGPSSEIIDRTGKLNIRNIGFVSNSLFTNLKGSVRDTGWVAFNFAFGFNKNQTNHFRSTSTQFNESGSFLDAVVDDLNANKITQESISNERPNIAALAWETYLIDPIDTNSIDEYTHKLANGGVQHSQRIIRRAKVTDWSVAAGANYSNKLYLGVNLGLPNFKSNQTRRIEEEDIHDTIVNFTRFTYEENVRTEGWGANLGIGAIVKLTPWWRIGLSVTTPTIYSLEDEFYTSISADLDTFQLGSYRENSSTNSFAYNVYTPAKFNSGMAFILKRKAIVSVDWEHIDYATTLFDLGVNSNMIQDINYGMQLNESIQTDYTSVNNIRVGMEYRMDQYITFRLGYAYYEDPYKKTISLNTGRLIQSAGLGYHDPSGFYFDMAYTRALSQRSYVTPTNQDIYVFERKQHFLTTLGFKF